MQEEKPPTSDLDKALSDLYIFSCLIQTYKLRIHDKLSYRNVT